MTDALLVACPTCGRDIGEVCIVGYSFAVVPHATRLAAAQRRDPLVCIVCGQRCEEDDFRWGMLDAYPRPRRSFWAFITRRPRPPRLEVPRQDICGYCTNWGVF